MATRPDASIRLASGRLIYGYRPGHSRRGASSNYLHSNLHYLEADRMEEYRLRDELARQLDGITEGNVTHGTVNLGFADVVTKDKVFEVEPHHSWRHGIRQVIQYAVQCSLTPALALFHVITAYEMRELYDKINDIHLPGLRVADSIELWWWTGSHWDHIVNPRQCADMPHGIRFGSCKHCGNPVAWYGDQGLSYEHCGGRPMLLHCCMGLCASEHAYVKGCLYWLVRRSSPNRSAGQ